MTRVDKDVEKLELSCTVGENVNGTVTTWGKQYGSSGSSKN